MDESSNRPADLTRLTGISITASLLGSVIAAVSIGAAFGKNDGLTTTVLIGLGTLYFGTFFSVPIGLLLGLPTLAVTRRILPRYILLVTTGSAILGLLGGVVLTRLGLNNGVEVNNNLIFGVCVGAMHPLVYSRLEKASWRSICAAFVLGVVVAACGAFAGESLHNEVQSQEEYTDRCFSPYDSLAYVADRTVLRGPDGIMQTSQGKWQRDLRWRSLYSVTRWVALNDARVLIARDFAYIPSSFLSSVSGGRKIIRHCLSENRSRKAALLRRLGLGKKPDLSELSDRVL